MREWVKAIPLGVLLPVGLWMTTVKPEDVSSNISHWVKFFGVSDVPHWLVIKSADHWIAAGSIVIAVIYSLIVWRVYVAKTAKIVANAIHHVVLRAETKPVASLSMVVHRAPRASEGIEIVLGSGSPFDHYRSHIHYKTHRIRVCVRNSSQTTSLTNCQLTLENISGRLANRCPVPIKTGFNLNPGQVEYVDFVELDEPSSTPSMGIVAHFPINKLSNGKSYLDDGPYDLTLKATAAESSPDVVHCRLRVEDGMLRLERRDATPAKEMPVERDAWLQDAVCYAVHRRWLGADEKAFSTEAEMGKAGSIADEMRQLAFDGKFKVWGKASFVGVYEPIPPEFWAHHQIDFMRLVGDEAQNVKTERTGRDYRIYRELMVSRAQTEAQWPPS